MHQTPWTKKTPSSSLPSDRLRPKASPASTRTKGTSQSKDPVEPQSKALRTLNALHASLQDQSTGGTPDPTGGCFCQARTHPLSSYTPICTSCGLPLCNLAAPAHPCPSCASPLITLAQRTSLIARVAEEITATMLQEQQARERAEAERRAAVGAFPSLSGSTGSSSGSVYPTLSSSSSQNHQHHQHQQTTHKVLSLNSKTKRAVLTTTTTKPRPTVASTTSSRPASPQPTREPRPGRHLDVTTNTGKGKGKDTVAVDPDRPWANLAGKECTYVPPSRVGDDQDGDADVDADGRGKGGGRRKRARGKGKEKEKENAAGAGGGGASGS